MAVSGVIWIPSQAGIGENPAHYAAELEAYVKSLPATLVPGITPADISGAKSTELRVWPKTLSEIATQLGTAAK